MTVHKDMKMADYLALPAVSASIVKTLDSECPKAAWFESWLNPSRPADPSDASDVGEIGHSIILEGHSNNCVVIDPNDHPAEKTGAIPAGWTNKSIKAARDAARDAGKIPVLVEDMVGINGMAASARAFIESLKDSEPAVWACMQPGGGDSELTVVTRGATPLRIRPDRISADRKLVVHLKTTTMSAEPESWARSQLTAQGGYITAAFYRSAIEYEFNAVDSDHVFLVVEQKAPYLCSISGITPEGYEIGRQKCVNALALWDECVARGSFPAYPNRVAYKELPAWIAQQHEERQAIGVDYDILFGRKA